VRNISQVAQAAPVYQQNFEKIIPKIVDMFHLEYAPTIRDLFKYIDLGAAMTLLAKMFTGFAGKTLIVMLYVGFLLYEQRYFDKKIIEMIEDQEKEDHVRRILKSIDIKIQRYIGVKSFVSAIDSLFTFMILSLFNVNFAGFWGLMAFFLHFIPYAGSFVAITMPSVIALIQYGDLTSAFIVLASLSVSHAFIGHVLDPFLMGDNLNLSPIFIISSLAMWGMIWGVPGMFLAIPILAIITITLSQFPQTRSIAILMSKTGVIDPDGKKEKP
jgi:AI-2 transport protein TqsA